ncbi:MAG: dTMP kinase [Bacteroidales bacterium]
MALIVIEGLDGAGKSTQINLLNNYFVEKGIPTHFLHFPRVESPFFGELIAKFLRGDLGDINQVDPYIVALLYASDRMDAASTIQSWLNNGHVVLLDRYVYSNIAFQCAKLSSDDERSALRNWIFKLEFDYYKIPKPDLNIFLDVPFEFTKSRLTQQRSGTDRDYLNGKDDIHEKDLGFQERVRKVYLEQEKIDNFFKVIKCNASDGSMQKPNEIFNQILSAINENGLSIG